MGNNSRSLAAPSLFGVGGGLGMRKLANPVELKATGFDVAPSTEQLALRGALRCDDAEPGPIERAIGERNRDVGCAWVDRGIRRASRVRRHSTRGSIKSNALVFTRSTTTFVPAASVPAHKTTGRAATIGFDLLPDRRVLQRLGQQRRVRVTVLDTGGVGSGADGGPSLVTEPMNCGRSWMSGASLIVNVDVPTVTSTTKLAAVAPAVMSFTAMPFW